MHVHVRDLLLKCSGRRACAPPALPPSPPCQDLSIDVYGRKAKEEAAAKVSSSKAAAAAPAAKAEEEEEEDDMDALLSV